MFSIISLWLIIHLILFKYFGIRNLLDAAEYLKRAEYIIKFQQIEDLRHIFYATSLSIITLFKWISPNSVLPFIIFQCVLSGFATVALYFTASKIFDSPIAGLFSCIIFLVWFDNIHWNVTLMTDQCLLRPTGAIILIGAIVFILRFHWSEINKRHVLKFSLVLCLITVGCIGTYIIFTYWDFTSQYAKGNIITFADSIDESNSLYRDGLRIKSENLNFSDSKEHPISKMFYFVWHNPIYFIRLGCMKIWFLVSTVRPYYSFLHNLFAATWIISIYSMFYIGWKELKNIPFKWFVFTTIGMNCFLIGIATVDWDNRFYIPMEPGIVVVAGGGAAYLYHKIINKLRLHSFY